jgi:hypothetical protein
MNDINAAQRVRVAALEKAEAHKVTVVKHAEAAAEAKFLEGEFLCMVVSFPCILAFRAAFLSWFLKLRFNPPLGICMSDQAHKYSRGRGLPKTKISGT